MALSTFDYLLLALSVAKHIHEKKMSGNILVPQAPKHQLESGC
jgi:hypothetical protein